MTRRGPFPGMDPWLESRWEGVHAAAVAVTQELLNEQLPDDLIARVDERVYVGYVTGPVHTIRPDVFVTPSTGAPSPSSGSRAAAAIDEPVLIRFAEETFTEGFVEIVDAADQTKVITAIEIISKTNKSHPRGRREYLRKRREYHRGAISVVEVDLLRGGRHLVDVPKELLGNSLAQPYRVCVRRGWKPGHGEVEYYAIPLRARLPRIRVPLRETDADAPLDLQAVIDTVYARGRYDRGIDYDRPPDPSLEAADAEWAQGLVREWRATGGR